MHLTNTKLIENTPTLLVYKIDEMKVKVIQFLGFLMIGIGFALIWQYNKHEAYVIFSISFMTFGLLLQCPIETAYIFDKTKGTFTLKRQNLFDEKIIEYNLSQIRDIELNERHFDESWSFGVVLHVSNKSIYLVGLTSSNRDITERTVSCIKTFLDL